jgi:hypothetical protein
MSDHRYLPVVLAEVYGRDDLRIADRDPEALWWAGALPRSSERLERRSVSYGPNRFIILRSFDTHVYICAAQVGMHGFGSHSHNDILSFEYWSRSRAWIVDPGTYLYTPDPESRNLFRSTGSHNTVRIDGEEINPFRHDHLFQMSDVARVTVHRWETSDTLDQFEAEHTGYLNLTRGGVRHRRCFRFDKETGELLIQDGFEGDGSHYFEWFFHAASDVRVESRERNMRLHAGSTIVNISFEDAERQCGILSGWYSPSYGVRCKTAVIYASCNKTVPFTATTRVSVSS